MTPLTALLPNQTQAAALDNVLAAYRDTPATKGAVVMPLDEIAEPHATRSRVAFSEFMLTHDGRATLADPELVAWHRIAQHEFQRLAASGRVIFLRGPAGTGKTFELVQLCKKWAGQLWYLCPTNVACEVVRLLMQVHQCPHAPSVQTPHTRYALAGQHGFEGFPKWWPEAPGRGRKVKNALVVLDEVYATDARTIALSLSCISSGSTVILSGDPLQNRPVDGCEMGYWLHEMHAHSVAAGDTPAHQLILAAAGRENSCEPSELARISNLPEGKTLSIELSRIRRSGNETIARAREWIFDRHQLPPAGPGFAITRTESLQKAIDLAVSRVGQGYRCVVPTNSLMIRMTGEINRAKNNPGQTLTFDFDEGEKPSDDLADGLYFRRGQPCMVLVNDHASGLHNGLICTYLRWHRPTRPGAKAWHEIEVPAKPGSGFGRHKYKLYYQPGRVSRLMSQSVSSLRAEIGDDEFAGLLLGDEQRDACAGLLCSPHVLTNHRAQGSTHEKTVIIIPPWLDKTQCAEWLYVAISRARTAVEIIFADDASHTAEQLETLFAARVQRLTTPRAHAPNLFAAGVKPSTPAEEQNTQAATNGQPVITAPATHKLKGF